MRIHENDRTGIPFATGGLFRIRFLMTRSRSFDNSIYFRIESTDWSAIQNQHKNG
ncbi:hypothetical protein LEP1GSC125_1184 [Leptospira mayottensis 200901122]|uniref:Uncharacterized protein n=1 Tax=Leptospira mayottensis 200901122 TaxID=1193010 RepID=A0AA87SXM5_9LEPT|nr:hypothetical protein LEP1GSC125_1184 [Leptospira mayottensis 200901122]